MIPGIGGIAGLLASAAAGGAFDPLDLFAGSEIGGWWDVQDLDTLWQDTAGTTPVTTAAQSIRRVDDKSGNGNHLLLAGATAPTYRVNGGGFGYVDTAGNSRLTALFTIGGGTDNPWHRYSVIEQNSFTNGDFIFGGGTANAGELQQVNASGTCRFFEGTAQNDFTNFSPVGEVMVAYERRWNSNLNRVRKNLGTLTNNGSGNAATGGFTVGARQGGTNPGDVHYYGGIIWSDGATGEMPEEDDIINYLADLCGVTV